MANVMNDELTILKTVKDQLGIEMRRDPFQPAPPGGATRARMGQKQI
jgi:hypothetical protein